MTLPRLHLSPTCQPYRWVGPRNMEPMTGLEPVTSSLPRTRVHQETTSARFRVRRAPRVRQSRRGDGRKLERETGIEPATNSLEGCDSTTELLPPSRTLNPFASAGKPACAATAPPPENPLDPFRSPHSPRCGKISLPAEPSRREPYSHRGGRRLVARGGFEPPKALGRQIYSLLRLTAPQPRQNG